MELGEGAVREGGHYNPIRSTWINLSLLESWNRFYRILCGPREVSLEEDSVELVQDISRRLSIFFFQMDFLFDYTSVFFPHSKGLIVAHTSV